MVKLSWLLVPLFLGAAAAQNAAVRPANGLAPENEVRATKPAAQTAATPKPVAAKPAAQTAATPKPAAAAPAANVPAPKPTPKAATLPHWVGPMVKAPIANACYRQSYLTRMKKCGVGYNPDGAVACWAQCPIEYPVECGVQCIQQNKDCTKALLGQATAVANVALTAATGGVFGVLTKAAKGVQVGVRCGQQLYNTVNKITGFIDQIEGGKATGSTKDKIVFAVMKSDYVVYDLPVAIATCIGIPVPPELGEAKQIINVVQKIVDVVVNKKIGDVNLLDIPTFLSVLKKEVPAVGQNISTLTPTDEATVKNLVKNGVKCGTGIYAVVNKIIAAIQDIKSHAPTTPFDMIKYAILSSNMVLNDLPAAASSCVDAATGFSKRDEILKSAHVIIEGVMMASSDDNGKPLSTIDYAMKLTKMGLDAISTIDPTGIADMANKFVQPICGPTAYIGKIDDGPADKALGLKTIEKAFRGSTGTWAAKGDGKLTITFKSVDTFDVTINVISGGKKVYSVPVKKGTTVTWSKPLSEFQGKTLYLDRWRAGFLGIPGTGGGSLLAWVPSHAATGSLAVQATINPTTFADHKLRN